MRATRPLASRAAISAQSLSKSFRLPHENYSTVREHFLHPFASRTYERLDALRDVTFDVSPGEFFGGVGKNGGGKSTLLKSLCGMYTRDWGEIAVDGRL